MASIQTSLAIVIALTLTLYMFGIATVPFTELMTFVLHPELWSTSGLIDQILAAVQGTLGLGIIIGLIFFRSDFMVFAAFFAALLEIAVKPLFQLSGYISSQVGSIMGVVPGSGDQSAFFLTLLIMAPLYIHYIFTAIAWWRGRID